MQLGAQQFSTTWLKEAAPRNIGPGGMSGRITSIDTPTIDTVLALTKLRAREAKLY